MNRTKAILVAAFLLAFAAGTSVGLFASKPPPPRRGGRESMLAKELNLSPEQQKQMHEVWSKVWGEGPRGREDRRAALAQERDQQIQGLLTEGQKAKYEAIQQDYSRKVESLAQERKRAFDEAFNEALERTEKEILTPEQAAKYKELMKRPPERGPGGPPGMRGSGGPPGFRGGRYRQGGPASGPATVETSTPHVGE
jgi:Spy/CpxP family protein refolding chaperone